MEYHLYEQHWGKMGIARVGCLVKTNDEVNAYRKNTSEVNDINWVADHLMLPVGTIGRLVAITLPEGTNLDADPDCVVVTADGTNIHCLGSALDIYNLEV